MSKSTSDCRATERKHPWPMVRLGDVCEVISSRGHQIKQSEILPSGKYPVVSQSENEIEGFSNKEICIADIPVVLFGDHTCNVKLINSPFVVGADGTKLLKPSRHCVQYLYYCLQLLGLKLRDGKYRRHFGDLCDSEVPLPPLSEQKEIVARLERELAAVEKMKKGFEALAETAKAEFKAELKEVFAELKSGGVEMGELAVRRIKLGEICEVFRGDYITRKTEQQGPIPVVLGGREPGYYINRFNHEGPCLVVSRSGASAGYVSYWNEPIFITDGFGIEPGDGVEARFLHYQILVNGGFSSGQDGAAIPHITGGIVRDYEILLPSLAAQHEVVARLDLAKARAEKLEAKAREGVSVCETMRKAILKEAFE